MTATAGVPAPDRATRRRTLENRATTQAFFAAVLMVWAVGLWFWGILAVVQIGLGIVLPRVLGPDSGISVSVGPVGAPQVFLFVMGVITGAGVLTVHVAAGGTRRSAWRGWVVAAPVVGASFAVVSLLVTALARLVSSWVGVPAGSATAGPFDDALPVTAGLAVLGTTAFLAGIAVNAGYRRFGAALGTLFLPVVLAPLALAQWGLVATGTSGGADPGVGSSPLGWLAAVVGLALAPVLLRLLLRRIRIA